MCTLTWLLEEQGYSIFFNRDEQRNRSKALVPQYYPQYDAIMPLDPVGGGTWIAVHRSGLTLCLLNHYQSEVTAEISENQGFTFISRGKIIPQLITCSTNIEILTAIKNIDLTKFQAFRLCVFSPGLSSSGGNPTLYSWNGKEISIESLVQPIISTAVATDEVRLKRKTTWHRLLTDLEINSDLHLLYHTSHDPEPGHLSVCMHRDDAATQSLSHIQVRKKIQFSYLPGSPCKKNKWEYTCLPTVSQ